MQKKKPMGLVVFWLLVVTTAGLAYGDNYYVAVDGSNDTGDGSETTPWATITHALDNVPDLSLILAKPGMYTGRPAAGNLRPGCDRQIPNPLPCQTEA